MTAANATFASAATKTPSNRRTTNGMKTNESSLNSCVDLFFAVGASRGKDIAATFERAYQEDRVTALRTLAWSRDVRGGAGERQTFINMLSYIETNHPTELPMMINVGPAFGRWSDILELKTAMGKKLAFDLIKEHLLVNQDGLCAKWMPRKGALAVELRKHLGLTPKGYRKTLVTLTKVVETAMCSGEWDSIEFGKLPSVASARYQKAFGRHAPEAYGAYKAALVTGEAKINAGAVYPYNVIQSLRMGDSAVAKAQWEALENFMGNAPVLPVCDVSGSMGTPVGGNKNLTCMDVCISLGLYMADKNSGPFKDCFLTFSDHSKIEVLRGDIVSKYNQLQHAEWGMSTDLNSAFAEILKVAKTNHVAEADMPKFLCVMSDMEYNQASAGAKDVRAFELAKVRYEEAGYVLPKIVWWNLNARAGNVPVTYNEQGAALVSGFSPSLMKSILKAEEFTPVSIMMETVNAPRYEVIV